MAQSSSQRNKLYAELEESRAIKDFLKKLKVRVNEFANILKLLFLDYAEGDI